MTFVLGAAALVAVLAVASLAFRLRMEHRVEALWGSLEGTGVQERFDARMVESLPEPGRRYLLHAIQPGTPLAVSVRLTLAGCIRLSRSDHPVPMESKGILAPPHGYVWKARVRKGPVTIRGFDAYADGEAEMRWWLAGLIPIAHGSGGGLARSAAGRLVGEAIFVPSTLLPARGALWEAVNESMVRVRMATSVEEVATTLEIDPYGSLRRIRIRRWNNDLTNGPVGYLSFVVDGLADETTFDGYTIPTRFRAGWQSDEGEDFPFYYANVTEADYR